MPDDDRRREVPLAERMEAAQQARRVNQETWQLMRIQDTPVVAGAFQIDGVAVAAGRMTAAIGTFTEQMREYEQNYRVQMERAQEGWRREVVNSMQLLCQHLTEAQRSELGEYDFFTITSSTGRMWQLEPHHSSGNVFLLARDGHRLASLCAHSWSRMPEPAHVLMQKLALENDELSFTKVANIFAVVDPIVTQAWRELQLMTGSGYYTRPGTPAVIDRLVPVDH